MILGKFGKKKEFNKEEKNKKGDSQNMKQSIYLTENVMRIVMNRLNQDGVQYETQMQNNGGLLFVEEKDISKCSAIVEAARREERELKEEIRTITCEVANKEKLDLSNIPNEPVAGNLVVVPIKKDGSIADMEYCWNIFRSPEEVLKESLNHLKKENFVIEKLNALLRQVMKEEGFEDGYIDETLFFGNGKDCPVWVLHNYPKKNGTVALHENWLMKIIYTNLEENFYILPTSKQESLIIPESQVNNLAALQELFTEISEDELRLDDAFSDQVLYFDGFNLTEAPEQPERAGVDITYYTEICSTFLRLRGF